MNSSKLLENSADALLSRRDNGGASAKQPSRSPHRAPANAKLLGAGLALAAALASVQPAQASVFNYGGAGTLHTVNAGILQLDSAGQVTGGQFNTSIDNSSGALYSFYILDQRTDYKPAGWRFLNPLAPTTVTSDLQAMYPSTYTLGQRITESMPAYWMVNLPSVAAGYVPGAVNPLADYDVLVIRGSNAGVRTAIGLTRAERELLRDYVDQGGTLWIEDAGKADTEIFDTDANKETPAGLFVDVDFQDGGGTGNAYLSDTAHRHPILTLPNFLTYPEVSNLDYPSSGLFANYLSSMGSATNPPGFDFMTSVVGNSAATSGTYGNLPSIAAGDFGSGHVVVDDCNVLGGISEAVQPTVNDTSGAPGNRGTSAGYAPTDLGAANVDDLQLAYNLISWSGGTSNTDGADARHSGAQTSADIGSSVLGTWTYPDPNYNTAKNLGTPAVINAYGSAISGNIAYVSSVDMPVGGGTATAMLHAFDLIPSEDLDQDGNPDDGDTATGGDGKDPDFGIPYTQDFSAGLNYDELWATPVQSGNATASRVSAPTIATIPAGSYTGLNSTGYYDSVLVEGQNGQVYIFDATSNPGTNLAALGSVPPAAANASFPVGTVIPSPIYSHGWLIAPQPISGSDPTVEAVHLGYGDSTPRIVHLAGSAATLTDTTNIIGTPAVAMVPSLDTQYGGSDIVAYVATADAVYPMFLGSRDEHVTLSGSPPAYSTKLSQLQPTVPTSSSPLKGVSALVNAPEDQFGPSTGTYGPTTACAYLSATDDWQTGMTGIGHVPQFRTGGFDGSLDLNLGYGANESAQTITDAYVDYDVVPGGTTPTLSRHQILATVENAAAGTAAIAGIAVGDDDTLYLTVNEPSKGAYVEAVQEQDPDLNNSTSNGTVVKWRYSIGTGTTLSSAPGLPAALLNSSAQIVGPPVVDKNHVYVLATQGGNAYVLCFNHNANFYVNVGGLSGSTVSLLQTDENGIGQTITSDQYNITDQQNGIIQITDFSNSGTNGYDISPNLSASIPVNSTVSGADTTNGTQYISSNDNGSQLLAWASGAIMLGATASGTGNAQPGFMREAGQYLYFGNGLNANGVTGIASVYNANGTIETPSQIASTVVISQPLAVSGSVMVGVGAGGVVGAAFNGTMVADNNRLIEYAPDGSPMWSLDSTTQQAPVANVSSGGTTEATTNVSLSRPSSVTLLASNDILFCDTGNNRCVRVDRGGNVLWELNSFNDPTGLLQAGQPLTLNAPASVVEWRESNPPAANPTAGQTLTIEHFLIADAGNNRIVEVDDYYTNGQIDKNDPAAYHVLRWVSHTFDKAGRTYRYVYASRYFDPSGSGAVEILAGVANRQIAPLVVTSGQAVALDTANRDSAGSSIVLLRYFPTGYPTYGKHTETLPGGGSITDTSYAAASYTTTPPTTSATYGDPLNGLPEGLFNQIVYIDSSNNKVTLPIRNLRYVDAYTPTGQSGLTGATASGENIIVADDDGVFDGIALGQTSGTPTYGIYAIVNYNNLGNRVAFSFTKQDYDGIASVSGSPKMAPNDVFTPTSAQRLDNGDYLITNGASAGDATPYVGSNPTSVDIANNNLHFGGDVIEVTTAKAQVGTTYGRANTGAVASGTTPTTAPLSQPAYAVRAQ